VRRFTLALSENDLAAQAEDIALQMFKVETAHRNKGDWSTLLRAIGVDTPQLELGGDVWTLETIANEICIMLLAREVSATGNGREVCFSDRRGQSLVLASTEESHLSVNARLVDDCGTVAVLATILAYQARVPTSEGYAATLRLLRRAARLPR
jgi:hypothetical protein